MPAHQAATRPFLGALLATLLGCGLLVAVVGCSRGPGYVTATVSGTVSIDGTPVPQGFITFNPAEKGPVTGAPIVNGQYRCEGVPVGKHTVTFQAQGEHPSKIYDAVNKVEHEVPTDILPPKYREGVPAEIEPGVSVRDFQLD